LGREYIRFDEVSRQKNSAGNAAYEAIVYIGREPKTGQYSCLWLDTTAVISPGSPIGIAFRRGDELPFLFQTKGDTFHTTFAYHRDSDTWEWRMDDEKNGALHPFARVKLAHVTRS
jgi:hypothetical protein